MKKKLFVFLTVIVGGLFILLYNPLKELASSSGEVKAAETYSAFEKFLMSEESGSYTPSTNETITHELNLSFTNKVTKTIGINGNAQGPVSTYINLRANIIIGNNCELTGLQFTTVRSYGGYIIMKGNGILSPTSANYNGLNKFDASCIRCDSSFYGNIKFTGIFTGTLTLDYGANFSYNGNCNIILGANFNGTFKILTNNTCTIENYLGPKNKIEITATASDYISSSNVKLSTTMASKFDLVLKKEESACYLVRKPIPKPTASTTIYEYNGKRQTYLPAGFDSATMDITNNTRTEVGTQYVTISLKDTSNQWKEGGNAAFSTIAFTINKASIKPSVSMAEYEYGGTKSSPSISGNPGNGAVTYYYSTSNTNTGGKPWSEVTSSTSLDVGTYYMYAVIAETTNYNGATTAAVPFEITKTDINPTVSMTDYTYGGEKSIPSVNVGSESATFYYNTSNTNTGGKPWSEVTSSTSLDAGTYYMYAIVEATASYNGATTAAVAFTISKADINPTVSMTDYTYGGEKSIPSVSIGSETATFYYNTSDTNTGGTLWSEVTSSTSLNVGTYYMYAEIGETKNYYGTTTAAVPFTINRIKIEKDPTESTETYTYDGTIKTYTPLNYDSTKMSISNETRTDAGSQDVTVKVGANYAWSDGGITDKVFTFTIQKADITGIEFSGSTITYDKDTHSLAITGTLPENVSVSYTLNGTVFEGASDVDTYNIKAEFTNNNNNYNDLGPMTATLTIQPKEVTVEFSNYQNLVYNKGEQQITVNIKEGVLDGDTCTITGITDDKGQDAGDYICVVTALSNPNYALSGKTSQAWSIAKYQVEKPTEDTTVYTYNGKEQTYQVEASEFYTVTNQTQKEAGTYIVTITLNDTDNYEWKNDPTKTELEYSFTIQQKAVEIHWNEEHFTYNGEEQDQSGIIAYYLTLPSSTPNRLTVRCNSESFKLAGTYTFSVELDDTKNYTVANSSDKHSYTIEKAGITLQAEDKTSAYGASLEALTYTVSGTNYHDEIKPQLTTTATTTSNAGTYPITITASNNNYTITLTNGTYTITKATPSITTKPTASSINLGHILAKSQLTGGVSSVDGEFTWVHPNTIPSVGTNEYEVIFTPTDTTNYNTVTTTASVTVNALPKDDNGNIKVDDDNYGDLKDILDDYDKLPEEDKNKIDDKTKEEIEKLRDAIDQYEEEKGIKTDPIILENPTASSIYLGQNLSNSTLSGGKANVDGEFTWVSPNTIPSVGTNSYEVVFTPTKLTRYNTVTITVSVTVNELPKDDDGNVSVDDDNYDDLKDIVDTYDKLSEEEKEKLDDKTKEEIEKIREGIEDYQREHGIKTDPIIFKNPIASKISYGQYLSSSNLSGGKANVEGEFTFSKPKLMPKKGIQTYEVVFTPTKSDVYNSVVLEVEVEVEDSGNIDTPVEVNKDNYKEFKEIVDNYNNLTEEEKNALDPEVREDIQKVEQALMKYKQQNSLSKTLIESIGIPCGLAVIAGTVLHVYRKRKKISTPDDNDEDEDD